MNPDCLLSQESGVDKKESITDPELCRKLALANYVLSLKAGTRGMLGGQVADIEAEASQEKLGLPGVEFIHAHKTAALLQAALMIGGILGGASKEQTDILERIGGYLGLAFQIKDDILDVTGDTEQLGKPVGSDAKNEKSTYVSLVGLSEAEQKMRTLSAQAASELSQLPGDKTFLAALFVWLMERNK